MKNSFANLPFKPADILLPKDCGLNKWSVVACDQYTSQPEYWARVSKHVGKAPSALHLILPESCLEGPDVEQDISEINLTMARYLKEGRFQTYPNSIFYVERKLENGQVRHGLIGMVDLEEYDYEPGSSALIRATEGTVLSRIPPRIAVRKNAPIELPHILLLFDDPDKMIIKPLSDGIDEMEQVYDFDLMEHGGHITGWKISEEQMEYVAKTLTAFADPDVFNDRYGTKDLPVLLFAAGDGNHSLATAKESYERQKRLTPPEQWANIPARYALAELGNLHDASLEFEPIHRIVFGVDPEHLLAALIAAYPGAHYGPGEGHVLEYVYGGKEGCVTVPNPNAQLPVGTLQVFLDEYLKKESGRIDYIHGEYVTRELALQPKSIGFLLPAMGKDELFPTVIHDGVLPRKTFSMGEAHDKRFYLEARKIR